MTFQNQRPILNLSKTPDFEIKAKNFILAAKCPWPFRPQEFIITSMNEQEIHIHIHTESPTNRRGSRPKAAVKPRGISKEADMKALMTRNLWERFLFEPFTTGLNPWINLQSARKAVESGHSVEIMGYEMDEARLTNSMIEKAKHTKGSIVTADDLIDFMIESGFSIAESTGIRRELMELYLESRIDLVGLAWDLSSDKISQRKAAIYQRELSLAS